MSEHTVLCEHGMLKLEKRLRKLNIHVLYWDDIGTIWQDPLGLDNSILRREEGSNPIHFSMYSQQKVLFQEIQAYSGVKPYTLSDQIRNLRE